MNIKQLTIIFYLSFLFFILTKIYKYNIQIIIAIFFPQILTNLFNINYYRIS
jgi:hypothetical protein